MEVTTIATDSFGIDGEPSLDEVSYAEMDPFMVVSLAMQGDQGAVDFLNSEHEHSDEGHRADISTHPMAVQPAEHHPSLVSQRRADKAGFNADADQVEPSIHAAMTALFEKQKRRTLSRIRGRRGRSQLQGHRSQPTGEEPVPRAPDAASIFDPALWVAETVKVVLPSYQLADELAVRRTARQVGHSLVGLGSTARATDVMRARANRMAHEVTDTTFRQITDTLAAGTDQGENMSQLADRVAHVFDVASSARAQNIARTETIGALNESSLDYAKRTGVIGRKQWLAHHDTRTRDTHRVADGMTVAIDAPFHVGGFPMQFPGDPSAPPDEVCQCRCGLKFIPGAPGESSKEAA